MATDWAHDYKMNWTFAAAPDGKLCGGVCGNFGSAVYTPYESGGDYFIDIPSSAYGGLVHYIRGVYLASVVFNWNGFWAGTLDVTPDNYYDSFENGSNSTTVKLTSNPGADVQIYYVYETTTEVDKNDGIVIYPYPVYWRNGESWTCNYPVDKLLEGAVYIWLEGLYRDIDTSEEYTFLWDEFKRYSDPLVPPLITDNFNRAGIDKYIVPIFINSTLGQVDSVLGGIEIISLGGIRCFKLNMVLPSTSDSAWYGYYLEIDNITVAPFNDMSNLFITIKGANNGDKLRLQLNRASKNDADKYTNQNYIYEHIIPDFATDWVQYDIPLNNFINCRNIYYDTGINCTFWKFPDTTDVELSEVVERFQEGTYWHESYKKAYWKNSPAYVLLGFANGSGYYGKPTGESELSFYLYVNSTSDLPINVEVRQDSTTKTASINPTSGAWHRITISFSSFDVAVNENDIEYIQLVVGSPTATGDIRVADVRFGDHKTFADEAEKLLLIQYYCTRAFGGNENQLFYIRDLMFGPNSEDPYPYAPYLAISVREYGQHYWRGPALVHYAFPTAPYICGDTDILKTYLDFHVDAQDKYYSMYGGVKGPIMPVHARNNMENIIILGEENYTKFCWWTDYPETNTGLAQYWAAKKAAEYYCLTQDSRILEYLENWISWIKAYAIDDTRFPDAPKGVSFPARFGNSGFSYLSESDGDWVWVTEGIAKTLLFWYWATGDRDTSNLLRRVLDDLRVNRWRDGYFQDNLRYLGCFGSLLRLFGLVVNGRPPGYGLYDFPVTQNDKDHFKELYEWYINNAGDTKPASCSSTYYIPYYYAEDYENWDHAPHYVSLWYEGTYEAVVNVMSGFLEWGKFSGDYTIYEKLKYFILSGNPAMSTKLEIYNLAILILGEIPIDSLNNTGKACQLLNAVYDTVRRSLLRDHPWNFALKRVNLSSSGYTPDWGYSNQFNLPSDCLRLIDVESTDSYRIEGQVILANDTSINILYIYENTNESQYDTKFVELLAHALAAKICFNITANATREKELTLVYREMLAAAKTIDGQEDSIRTVEFVGSWIESMY